MKKKIFLGIVIFLVLVMSWIFGLKTLLANVENITYDYRAKISTDKGPFSSQFSKADKDIIILAADDTSFQKFSAHPELGIGRWPWKRQVFADITNYLGDAKPKAIVFDIKFEGQESRTQDGKASDKAFSEALKDKNVTLGMGLYGGRINLKSDIEKMGNPKNVDFLISQIVGKSPAPIDKKFSLKVENAGISDETKNIITFYQNNAIYKPFLDSVSSVGIINLTSSEDFISRKSVPLYRLISDEKEYYLPSLPLAAILSVDKVREIKLSENKIEFGNKVIPIKEGRVLVNWHGKGGTYKHISLSDVILTIAEKNGTLKTNVDFERIPLETLKDKIIIIGQTSAGSDIHPTPMQMAYPGPEIIATLIDNYKNDAVVNKRESRKFVQDAPFVIDMLVLLLFCLTIGYFNIKSKSLFSSLSISLLMFVSYVLLAVVFFAHPQIRISLNMTYTLLFMIATSLFAYIYRTYRETKSKKAVEGLFGKFVSPQVLQTLLENPQSIEQTNRRKEMSVLFCDIRGFTSLSENIEAGSLVAQLNEYLSAMVDVILDHNGTFDKFVGDAVMAFFGDPLPMENHQLVAVLTAIDMQKRLDRLNLKWTSEGKPNFKIGIGINCGEMIVGYMGSDKIVDYTVIGDNVNLASRVENLNKNYGTTILVTENVYNEVKEQGLDIEYVDETKVKGKQNAVKIYKVNF